jgi:RNA polymerase sigma-70 factor, ECF subfamily
MSSVSPADPARRAAMTSLTRFPACMRAFAAELDAIHRALRRHGITATDAEDLAQEVFLVMWRRWEAYDPARPLRPWVLGIAFRVAQDHRKRPRREVPAGLIEAADPCPWPDQELAERRARSLVRSALGALPDKQRTVMILHDLEGLAMAEIAGALREPLTTLYSRLVTARRSFARHVRRMDRVPSLAGPGMASPEALLAVEKLPDPPPPEARARILRRVRSIAAAPGAGPIGRGAGEGGRAGHPGDLARAGHPGRGAPALASGRGGFLFGAGGAAALAVLTGTLLLLSTSPPQARARHPVDPDGTAARPCPAGSRDCGRAATSASAPMRPPRLGATFASALPGSIAAAEAPRGAGLSRGLIGYWRFDEAPGSPAARDLSGHGTDCHLRGLDTDRAWVGGRLAGAVNLTGLGWLECPDPRFGAGPDLTVAVWVKRTRAQAGLRVLATRQLEGPRDHFFFGFDGEELSLASHVWNGTLHRPMPGAPRSAIDHWIHVAAVHRDGRVELFVDGVSVAARRSYPGRKVTAATPLLIGAGVNGPDPTITTQRLAATVDELLVYNRALSPHEIATLADGLQPPTAP